MRSAYPDHLIGSKGFTLIETLIVMVVLGIAAVSMISLQGNIFSGQDSNRTMQVGVQLMQECAEQILATRRSVTPGYGYSSITTTPNICSGLGNYGGISGAPTVTVADNLGNTSCTVASSTCLVTVSIANLTPITLQLVNY